MRKAQLLAACLFYLSVAASAQQADALAGKWSGVMATQAGEMSVSLSINDADGVWRMSGIGGKGRKNPCLERDMPVVVRSASSTDLTIHINGDSVIKGCINSTATLKLVDGKSLEGSLTDGRRIKLNRQ